MSDYLALGLDSPLTLKADSGERRTKECKPSDLYVESNGCFTPSSIERTHHTSFSPGILSVTKNLCNELRFNHDHRRNVRGGLARACGSRIPFRCPVRPHRPMPQAGWKICPINRNTFFATHSGELGTKPYDIEDPAGDPKQPGTSYMKSRIGSWI